jgi:monoamine oxidase
VTVVVRDTKTGATEPAITADWCISTIPLPLLSKIKNNFDQEYRNAIAAVPFEATCKVGWQADRRFWEQDDEIYGGISFTTHEITQMWYSSFDFFGQKGVLTGAYNYAPTSEKFGALSLKDRLKVAMEGARLLHPNLTEKDIPIEKGLSIAWQNVQFQNGGWADWTQEMNTSYTRLLSAEGQFFVAGDQMSQLPCWQEGAIRSAQWVVRRIALPEPVAVGEAKGKPQPIAAPDTRAITRGTRRKKK